MVITKITYYDAVTFLHQMCGRYLSHGGITVYIPSLLFFVPSQLVSSLAQIATTDREFGIPTTYRQRANIKFLEYAKPIVEQFFVYGVKPKSLSVKKMDKRWGYCTTDGHISLNPRLICAPRCCIEYVITHELCHLIYRNHNKEFYALLAKEMPHWEKWKNKLEKIMM